MTAQPWRYPTRDQSEVNALARRVPCSYCGAPRGARCRAKAGHPTDEHHSRYRRAKAEERRLEMALQRQRVEQAIARMTPASRVLGRINPA